MHHATSEQYINQNSQNAHDLATWHTFAVLSMVYTFVGTVLLKTSAEPLARIVTHSTHSRAPEWFTTAAGQRDPESARESGLGCGFVVDLFEIDEAFACVAMAPIAELGIPHTRSTSTAALCARATRSARRSRLVVTLIHALKQRGGKRGVASLCIGGGEATALGSS